MLEGLSRKKVNFYNYINYLFYNNIYYFYQEKEGQNEIRDKLNKMKEKIEFYQPLPIN